MNTVNSNTRRSGTPPLPRCLSMDDAARAKCEELGIPYPPELVPSKPQASGVTHKQVNWTEETEETKEIKEVEELEETKEPEVSVSLSSKTQDKEARDDVEKMEWEEIQQVIAECRLRATHTSNNLLFQLARRVMGLERRFHHRYSPILLRKIFDMWEALSRDFLRLGHDYFVEFCVKLAVVRQPYGEKLASVIEAARHKSPPRQVLLIHDPDAHLLASVCRELQLRARDEPFYLIGRAYAILTGRAHSTIALWLKAFQTLGIIIVVEQGRQGYGSRYRYVASD